MTGKNIFSFIFINQFLLIIHIFVTSNLHNPIVIIKDFFLRILHIWSFIFMFVLYQHLKNH
uniref:Uncharacterized protein n=1 Tax=Phlebotomus papatasi TaxID=29031 RepID=A0A1B0CZ66_PHLPP